MSQEKGFFILLVWVTVITALSCLPRTFSFSLVYRQGPLSSFRKQLQPNHCTCLSSFQQCKIQSEKSISFFDTLNVPKELKSHTKLFSSSTSKNTVANDTISSKEEDPSVTTSASTEIINDISIPTPPSPSSPEYTTILSLLFAVATLSALDRVAMSVAILPIAQEFGLSETLKGQIASAFSAGYGLAVIPCGLLVGTFSPKIIMAFGVTLWSIGTFLTPLATSGLSSDNFMILLGVRGIVGAAESLVLPTVQRFLSNWVPSTQKSVAIATIFAGFQTGTICAYLISPSVMEMDFLIEGGGWRQLFYIYGGVGLLWLGPWLYWAKDSPDTVIELNEDAALMMNVTKITEGTEKDDECRITNTGIEDDASFVLEDCLTIEQQTTITSSPLSIAKEEALKIIQSAPWKQILTSKGVIAMTLAHAANNWGLYNNLSWTPTFYSEQYGLNVRDSAMLSLIPSIAGAIGGLSAGSIADYCIQNQWFGLSDEDGNFDTTNIRKAFQGIALLGPSLCLSILSTHMPESPDTARLLLTFTVGLQAFNAAGYGAATQEKAGEKWAGLLYSMTSLPGVLFGTFGVYLTGQILDYTDNNWSWVFGINAFVDVLGALAFIGLYNSKQEFD